MLIFKHNIKSITGIFLICAAGFLSGFFAPSSVATASKIPVGKPSHKTTGFANKTQADWVIRQNLLKGSDAWRIKGPPAGTKLEGDKYGRFEDVICLKNYNGTFARRSQVPGPMAEREICQS